LHKTSALLGQILITGQIIVMMTQTWFWRPKTNTFCVQITLKPVQQATNELQKMHLGGCLIVTIALKQGHAHQAEAGICQSCHLQVPYLLSIQV
jgi:hypothetical protein